MSKLPALSGKELIKILNGFGFEIIRIKGSHHFIRHSDGRSTVVPIHGKETIGAGLFHKILRDCEISVDDVLKSK